MCFELDSLPPIPIISGAAVSHDEFVLEASDANKLAAFAATPEEPTDVGVVVLPDVRGLYRFYEALALCFAERGSKAVAIDWFGRTAGVSKRDDDFPYMEHVEQGTPEEALADAAAGVRLLRDAPVLALQAGDDQNITPADNAAFERAFTDAGVEHEVVTYEGAPHSFFDRRQEDYAEPSEDAWAGVLAFIERHA
jgi:carboxymethylenebutenolidase